MPGTGFVIGDRVVAKSDGHVMNVVSIRPAGTNRMAVYCAWGPDGHRVIKRFLPGEIDKVPRPDRAGQIRSAIERLTRVSLAVASHSS